MTEEQAKFLEDLHGWKIEENEDVKLIESTITCRNDNNLKGFDVHYFQYKQREPKGILIILHGLTNCAELKAPIANVFKKSNFENNHAWARGQTAKFSLAGIIAA